MSRIKALLLFCLCFLLVLHNEALASGRSEFCNNADAEAFGKKHTPSQSLDSSLGNSVESQYDSARQAKIFSARLARVVIPKACNSPAKVKEARRVAERGRKLLMSKHDSRALCLFNRALNLDLRCYPALVNRSVALSDLHQYDEAERDLLQAMLLRSDNAEAFNNLGTIYEERDQNLDLARYCYERAVEQRPGNEVMPTNLFEFLLEQEDYNELLERSKVAVLRFASASSYDYYSTALWGTRRFDEALVAVEKGLKLFPVSKDLLARRCEISSAAFSFYLDEGAFLEKRKCFSQALQFYGKAIAVFPSDYRGYYYRGALLGRLDREYEAIRDLNIACRLAPDCSLIYEIRSFSRALTGQYAGAVADLTKSMRSRRSFVPLSTRSLAYSSMRDYDSAIKDLDEALTLSDKRTAIICLRWRSNAKWRAGDLVGAALDRVNAEYKQWNERAAWSQFSH